MALDTIEQELAKGGNLSIINLVNFLIEGAYKLGASDIHIDPQADSLRIRLRIDGVLQDETPFPKIISPEVISRIKILAGLTRLRQICCHPALFVDGYKGSSAKFEQLIQIVEESKLSGRRVLIFSQFTKMLDLIGRELTNLGLPFFYLDGQTPSADRVEICNRFNVGERDLFLISLKAGGTGLNLTGADTVILYDIWWNPAVE